MPFIELPESGYTPSNYKALVKLTNLSNADFYRQFEIPEQTFYCHYKGTRTMKWQDWQALMEAVTSANRKKPQKKDK